jgi:phosphoglycolate phosphatase-like HAD superfamily hydrolase
MAGRIDPSIVIEVAALHGVPCDGAAVGRFRDAYLGYLANEVEQPGPRKGVMPGVRRLLDTLAARDDVYLALLTGNFEGGARVKLEYFDLWRYFRCGAFGDDAPERNGLLAKALERVASCGGPSAGPSDVVVIGDTPLDVGVATSAGARSVAVATGGYDADTLRSSGADVVFDDLSDTGAVLAALILRSAI